MANVSAHYNRSNHPYVRLFEGPNFSNRRLLTRLLIELPPVRNIRSKFVRRISSTSLTQRFLKAPGFGRNRQGNFLYLVLFHLLF